MIKIEMSSGAQKSIKKFLEDMPAKAPSAIKKALNETAKQARKQLSQEAQKQYSVKSGRFNKAMKIKSASVSSLETTIKATGEVMELKDFKVSPNKYSKGPERPDITKGKVYKAGSLKNLQKGNLKAFIARFKSGHMAVVQRVPGKKMKSNPKKEFIKKLLSPSIPTMLGNEEKVFGIVEQDIRTNLQDNLSKYINEILEG